MKVAKRTAQAFASIVVLSLLMTGSVFAYSTRLSHISSFAAPSPLADDKSSTTKTSTSETEHGNDQVSETTHTGENEGEHTLQFKLVAVGTAAGKGDTEVQIRGTDIRVDLQVEQAQKSASYSVTLIASPTSDFTISSALCAGSIGTLMTSDESEAEAKLKTSLSPGTYFLAVLLCIGGNPMLTSDPANQKAIISPATTTESETSETDEVNAKQEDQKDQDDIKSAKDSKEIPSVVEVSSTEATITQLDSKFSVSVSRPGDNSLSVSIAGANITGPRVLLINLAKDAGALSSLASLRVTYDGNKISQASSLSQVLSGTSTSPPSYVVLATSSGVQLLVFIPHFSSHLIELLASPAPLGTFIAQAPLLLAGFAAVAAVAAALFMRRKRFAAPAAL